MSLCISTLRSPFVRSVLLSPQLRSHSLSSFLLLVSTVSTIASSENLVRGPYWLSFMVLGCMGFTLQCSSTSSFVSTSNQRVIVRGVTKRMTLIPHRLKRMTNQRLAPKIPPSCPMIPLRYQKTPETMNMMQVLPSERTEEQKGIRMTIKPLRKSLWMVMILVMTPMTLMTLVMTKVVQLPQGKEKVHKKRGEATAKDLVLEENFFFSQTS
mmetsp:Transcript_3839/g.4965  ORF Transcript_3839/g.4965 Transcript_3839/m.4965 type:complete len:211 (-) Transcript_3839:2315-2947(-)